MVRPVAVERDSARTLESLMAIVLVYENIIYTKEDKLDSGSKQRPVGRGRTLLGLSWLMVWLRREAEVGHLRALRQQPADGGIVRHDDRHAPSTAGVAVVTIIA